MASLIIVSRDRTKGELRMTIEGRIEEASRRRREAEAGLYRPDGSKYFSDEEHAERMSAIKARHRAEFDAIDADVERRVEEAE